MKIEKLKVSSGAGAVFYNINDGFVNSISRMYENEYRIDYADGSFRLIHGVFGYEVDYREIPNGN